MLPSHKQIAAGALEDPEEETSREEKAILHSETDTIMRPKLGWGDGLHFSVTDAGRRAGSLGMQSGQAHGN